MKTHRILLASLTLLGVIACVCSCAESGFTTDPLGNVTRIELTDNASRPLKVISDPAQIRSIVAFVDSHRMSWTKPFPDTPIPRLIANFYNGTKFVGHFGAGKTFFETQCQDDFCSQNATHNEVKQFLGLLDEPESLLNWH